MFLSKPKSEGIRERVLRYYNSLLIYLPDKELGWLPFAVWRGVWLIRQRDIDAIVTTSPPHSVQLIGLLLKWLTGRVWIVDFRDPWEVELKPNRQDRGHLIGLSDAWSGQSFPRATGLCVSRTP